MINKFSKLYKDQDYTITTNVNAHQNPLYAFRPQVKYFKQKNTPLGIMLKGVIKQRMFGNIINQIRIDKLENNDSIYMNSTGQLAQTHYNDHLKLFNHHKKNERYKSGQLGNILQQKSIRYRKSIDYGRPSFISSIQLQKKSNNKQLDQEIQIKTQRQMVKRFLPVLKKNIVIQDYVNKQLWDKISRDNKLKKQDFQNLLTINFSKKLCDYFIRYFEPPFQCELKKFNQFISQIINQSPRRKYFFLFQYFDFNRDGFINSEDLFNSYKQIQDCQQKNYIQKEIFKLFDILKQRAYTKKLDKSIEQFLSTNHEISMHHLSHVIQQQHKPLLQSNIKKYTGYKNTFQVTEHNQQTRQHKLRLQQIKNNLQKGMKGMQIKQGLNYQNYVINENQLFDQIMNLIS